MFERFKTEGIIVNKKDSGEFNRIFTAYTKDFGKIFLLGRAIRKATSKLKPGIDFFYLLDLEFIQGKGQKMLVDSRPKKTYQGIKKNVEKISVFDEIIKKLNDLVSEEEKDSQIWDLLKKIIYELDISKNNSNISFFYFYFIWNLLSKLGYQPLLDNCSICGKKIENISFFDLEKRIIVCEFCSNPKNIVLSKRFIQILKIILSENWELFSKIKFNQKDKNNFEIITEYFLDIY